MPTTANNETLERIKKDAKKYAKEVGKFTHISKIDSIYEHAAISERNKAIDEAKMIVRSGIPFSQYRQTVLTQLEALKSDKK